MGGRAGCEGTGERAWGVEGELWPASSRSGCGVHAGCPPSGAQTRTAELTRVMGNRMRNRMMTPPGMRSSACTQRGSGRICGAERVRGRDGCGVWGRQAVQQQRRRRREDPARLPTNASSACTRGAAPHLAGRVGGLPLGVRLPLGRINVDVVHCRRRGAGCRRLAARFGSEVGSWSAVGWAATLGRRQAAGDALGRAFRGPQACTPPPRPPAP